MSVSIRRLREEDRSDWERLYRGYADFYQVGQTPAMRQRVWSWIMDPSHEVEAFIATDTAGCLVGLAHFRAFSRPLAATVGGFLDDLFVDPQARGSGAAAALIAAIAQEGERRGWSVIRWITADDNDRARRVYDRLAVQTRWVTYDLKP
ncbi:MAG: GNAT family N-acetyltransferase [Azospirillum sp.]|nr:GNAT family N-acetyltransferase [Azospirillum sp.]